MRYVWPILMVISVSRLKFMASWSGWLEEMIWWNADLYSHMLPRGRRRRYAAGPATRPVNEKSSLSVWDRGVMWGSLTVALSGLLTETPKSEATLDDGSEATKLGVRSHVKWFGFDERWFFFSSATVSLIVVQKLRSRPSTRSVWW